MYEDNSLMRLKTKNLGCLIEMGNLRAAAQLQAARFKKINIYNSK